MKYKWLLVPLIGNIFEWYEFAIFSGLSLVIGKLFFDNHDPFSATISGFMTYGIAYVSRPFGTLFFGYLGDKYGRKKALFTSLLIMCLSTLLIPFLPLYVKIGQKASLILILVRMIQGFSLGGEHSSVVTYTCENAPEGKKARFGSLQSAGPIFGTLFGFITLMQLNKIYSDQEILDFAWRIPFFLAILLGIVGLYIRISATESPEFIKLKASNKIVNNPVIYFLKYHHKIFFTAMLLMVIVAATTQTFAVGSKAIFEVILKYDQAIANKFSMIIAILTIITAVFSGYLCDKWPLYKIRKIYTIILPVIATFGITLLSKGAIGTFYPIIGVGALSIMGGLWLGFYPYYLYKNIPVQIRDTGVGLSIAIPAIVSSFSMVVFVKLFQTYSFAGIYLFFMVLSVIAFIGLYFDCKFKICS
jgi:MFS family permease